MKKAVLLILFFLAGTSLFGQEYAKDSINRTYIGGVGVKFMAMEYGGDPFYVGEIPAYSRMASLVDDYLFLSLNTNLTWGLTHFFFDYCVGADLRYYPQIPNILKNNKFLSFYSGGEVGTFFFNNVTLLGRVGSEIDVFVADDTSIFVGGELFYRKEYRLANYIEKDYWFISSPGWSINGGFRIRLGHSSTSGQTRTL